MNVSRSHAPTTDTALGWEDPLAAVNEILVRSAQEQDRSASIERRAAAADRIAQQQSQLDAMEGAANARLVSGLVSGAGQALDGVVTVGRAHNANRRAALEGGANPTDAQRRTLRDLTASDGRLASAAKLAESSQTLSRATSERVGSQYEIDARSAEQRAERARDARDGAQEAAQRARSQIDRAIERTGQAIGARAQLASALNGNIHA